MKKGSTHLNIEEDSEQAVLTIPAVNKADKQSWLFAWVILWTFCGLVMFYQYTVEHADENFITFLIIWTGFWFYFEYKVVYAYRWRKFGKEIITFKGEHLTLLRLVGKRGIPRSYHLEYIKNVRLFDSGANSFFKVMNDSYWIISGEQLAFDYQGKTIVFGLELSERDAKAAYKWLTNQLTSRKKD
jgi:hypothetical protein